MSVLPDKADIFAPSLLISYRSFFISNLIIGSNDLLYIYFKRFFLNRKGLSDGKVVSLTKKEYGSALHFFIDLYEIFKINL